MILYAHAKRVDEYGRQYCALVVRTVDETLHGTSHPPATTYFAVHTNFVSDIAIFVLTRSPAIAEGPRDAGVPVEIW